MLTQRQPSGTERAVTHAQLLEHVRYEGAYPTRERAEEVLCAVLSALGRQLSGDVREELAACLPGEAARVLTGEIPDTVPLTGSSFVHDLAARTGGTPATTRWDAGTVLAAVGRLAGDDLLDRVLARLPRGYALLFGRAELTTAA
ncbi:hypothetical protein GCM10023347_09380 [Streptomyces chumphonensis]|uniref:DUF2267 domain-containing protein n=1 Tax=Streptomyces chumphonensis TaxID=1214925 RepID=A0A927IED2_9ACTN|nr:DUF2267 domain-containing protein [Streptomyces chumphonensis]MBD3934052.1 DUF2267 domain-containing protein [Streptomyces chumphonensis]